MLIPLIAWELDRHTGRQTDKERGHNKVDEFTIYFFLTLLT